ncbi:hypothetical protein H1C71_042271 [Ictidomys tridecemlineatus]|nr:hypothetical protein H1C71_042271 [Ictidomys tridecemlineatus]
MSPGTYRWGRGTWKVSRPHAVWPRGRNEGRAVRGSPPRDRAARGGHRHQVLTSAWRSRERKVTGSLLSPVSATCPRLNCPPLGPVARFPPGKWGPSEASLGSRPVRVVPRRVPWCPREQLQVEDSVAQGAGHRKCCHLFAPGAGTHGGLTTGPPPQASVLFCFLFFCFLTFDKLLRLASSLGSSCLSLPSRWDWGMRHCALMVHAIKQ